ncbi:MAG: RnfABCDGE type electron transport complex subunit B [Gammaproteobacteria bacterium]
MGACCAARGVPDALNDERSSPSSLRMVSTSGSTKTRHDALSGICLEGRMRIARIVEADCIGCTKCLKVCPVDAIVGAAGQMHTVLIEQCTGCEQCLPPCPVDCIELVEAPFAWDDERAQAAQARERARENRLAPREEADGQDTDGRGRSGDRGSESEFAAFDPAAAPAVIRAAVERSQARRRGRPEVATDRDAP